MTWTRVFENPLIGGGEPRDWQTPGYERVRCGICGERGEVHRSGDGHCPGFGPFPRWPTTIKDDAKAGALFDKRLARFWNQRKTYFRDPRRA